MSRTAPTTLSHPLEHDRLISPLGWAWIVALGGLFALFHWVTLRFIVLTAWHDSDWSHALLLPVISIVYLAMHREELAAIRPRVSLWGLPVLLLGMLSYLYWIYPGQIPMYRGYSMIIGLAGLVLLLLGPSIMRVAWFAIAYLLLGVPVGQTVWDELTARLQDIAATGAAWILEILAKLELPMAFAVERMGNQLSLFFTRDGVPVTESLNVAEACSGLRSLMAFVALSVAIAFFNRRPWWHRLILVLSAVPIAVGINVVRVSVVGIIALYDIEAATGDFHTFVGLLMLIPAGLLFLGLDWVLTHLLIRENAPKRAIPPVELEPLASASQPRRVAVGVGAGVLLAIGLGLVLVLVLVELDGHLVAAWLGWVSTPLLLTLAVLVSVATAAGAVWLFKTGADVHTRMRALAVAGGFLLAASGVQWFLISQAKLALIKEPLELREPLTTLGVSRPVGTWKMVRLESRLPEEIEEKLGTLNYVTATFQDLSWPEDKSGGFIQVHLAYYTGGIDLVAHVPTRCFVAGGAIYRTEETVVLSLDPDRYRPAAEGPGYFALAGTATDGTRVRVPQLNLPVTRFTFSPPENPRRNFHVLYFFSANGSFYHSPKQVRRLAIDPRDRYAYYCKIELRPLGIEDPQLAQQRCTDLLDDLMPQIMARLPDWYAVTHPQATPPPAAAVPAPVGVASADAASP